MPTFRVIVTSDMTESCVLYVEAADADEANQIAVDKANADPSLKWEVDDGNGRRPYIGDPDGAEEIKPALFVIVFRRNSKRNPLDPYTAVGPFATREVATAYAVEVSGNPDHWIVELS